MWRQAGLQLEILGEISIHCDSFAAVRPAVTQHPVLDGNSVTIVAMDLRSTMMISVVHSMPASAEHEIDREWLSSVGTLTTCNEAFLNPSTMGPKHVLVLLRMDAVHRWLTGFKLYLAYTTFPGLSADSMRSTIIHTSLETTDASTPPVYLISAIIKTID